MITAQGERQLQARKLDDMLAMAFGGRYVLLLNALFAIYAKIWGRSELRMGNLDKGLVFVDCITRERDAPRVIAALKPHMHLQTVALHDSKFQGDSVTNAITRAGLYRETPRAVFAMTSS